MHDSEKNNIKGDNTLTFRKPIQKMACKIHFENIYLFDTLTFEVRNNITQVKTPGKMYSLL